MVSFWMYDVGFLIVFTLALIVFLYRKKNLKREGIMYLYKTQVGVKVIDYLGDKNKKLLLGLGYFVIILGYLLMAGMVYLLGKLIYIFSIPSFVQAIKIPPLMPLIPYLPNVFKVTWLPPFYFVYWILAIAIVAIVHEGAHGVYARVHNVRIKSTGFGFLGPFLAFFVEQDDEQMVKKSKFAQMSILGAGVFANMVTAAAFYILMIVFLTLSTTPAGVMINDYSYAVVPFSILGNASFQNQQIAIDGMNFTRAEINGKNYFIWNDYIDNTEISGNELIKIYEDLPAINLGIIQGESAITGIEGRQIKNAEELGAELAKHKPADSVVLEVIQNGEIKEVALVLGESYETEGKSAVGIGYASGSGSGVSGILYNLIEMKFLKESGVYYAPKYNIEIFSFFRYLLWWIILINLSVALMNMLPVGMFDGGRFFYLTILGITKSEKIAKKAFHISTFIILGIFALLMILWAINTF